MRLRVRHQTTYTYSAPIASAIQTLRMTPQAHEGLAVLRWTVAGDGRRPLAAFIDGFGNEAYCHSVNRPHERMVIRVEGEVETRDTGGVVRGAREPLPPLFFLRRTPLTQPSSAIAAIAEEGASGAAPLDKLMALMEAVRMRMDYRSGVTDPATTADQALARGAGVCQDHAHLFIAASRHLGVPARYVSGYLWAGEAVAGHEASHAWAEAWVAGLGWVGFDPSNRARPDAAYIRTAIGLDYWSAAPVRGLRRGGAGESLDVEVRVTQAGAAQ